MWLTRVGINNLVFATMIKQAVLDNYLLWITIYHETHSNRPN